MLDYPGKKMFGSLESCYRRKQSCSMNDFPRMLECLFHPVQDLDHDLQHPRLLSKTVNAVVWQIKRRGKYDHSWLQSLARDRLIVVLAPFYSPCPWFRPPGDYFRATKMGLCLPKLEAQSLVLAICVKKFPCSICAMRCPFNEKWM